MSTAVWIVLGAAGLIAIIRMLDRISEMTGNSDRSITEILDQVRSEVDVFRGRRTPDDRPWDGQHRIATLRRRFR